MEMLGLDICGCGFWVIGMGILLIKTYKKWDLYLVSEVYKLFFKKVSNEQFEGTIVPGWGWSSGLGIGYSIYNMRLAASLTWFFEDASELQSTTLTRTEQQQYTSGALTYSYSFLLNWQASISYSDQTLFGSPKNTSLSKSVALQVQKTWDR
jgi:hypothetical protein